MNDNKNPVIQSVFDRKLQAADETFFVKASYELKDYMRQITEKNASILNDDAADPALKEAHQQLSQGVKVGVVLLDSFIDSFDVMSQDSQVFF